MGPIDREGTFRGTPVEWAVSETKNKYPQFVVRLMATEKWVETAEEMEALGVTEPSWVPWAEYEQSMVGYLVLFNNDGPIFNYEQVQAALGWDGASFSGLSEANHLDTTVLFRVEENTYQDVTRLQIAWIDEKDASIERTLRALDPEKLKALDSRYVGMLNTKKAAPASKPGKPMAPKAKDPRTEPVNELKDPPVRRSKAPPSSTAKPPVGKAKPSTTQVAPPPKEEAPFEGDPGPKVEACTMDDAWTAIQKAAGDDDKAASVWVEAANAAGIEDQESATNEDWADVRSRGLAVIAA